MFSLADAVVLTRSVRVADFKISVSSDNTFQELRVLERERLVIPFQVAAGEHDRQCVATGRLKQKVLPPWVLFSTQIRPR